MTDAEIRGRLLKHFYDLRHSNGGWVPTSEIILSPDQVSRQAIANVCQHLAEAGYIRWEPFNPPIEQHAIGRAKITGTGIDVVTGTREPTIDIRFPGMGERGAALRRSTTGIVNIDWMDEIEELVKGRRIDSVTMSRPNENHIILRDDSGQSIEIASAGPNSFRMKEDVGISRGGFQTQVVSQPARWSFNGPPITWDEVIANTKRWLGERRHAIEQPVEQGALAQQAAPIAPASEEPLFEAALTEIRNTIVEIKSQLPTLVASNAVKAEIVSDVAQIDTELERPTPRRKFLKTFLESLRDNLAKGAAAGLVALVGAILAKIFHVF